MQTTHIHQLGPCPLCSEVHEWQEIIPLENAPSKIAWKYTHYYMCPNLKTDSLRRVCIRQDGHGKWTNK